MTNRTNIGFMGGCINSPIGVSPEAVYHNQLKSVMPETTITIGKYHTYSKLIVCAEKVIKNNSLEILFVFLRHFPYMTLNKPLVKLVGKNNRHFYTLHPFLLNRKLKYWPKDFDQFVELYDKNPNPKRFFLGLRDINALVGKGLGLHKWASEYVVEILKELHTICQLYKCRLVIIGPPKNPETFMGNEICTYLNHNAKLEMKRNEIDFIDINAYTDNENNSIFQKDKIHYNEKGHKYLFDKIIERFEKGLFFIEKKRNQ